MRVTLATAQFSVRTDPEANLHQIQSQMQQARAAGAAIIHFPEGALSGYIPVDRPDFQDYPWPTLRRCTEAVMSEAQRLGLWVVLGSAHPLSAGHKPHNCLYLIDDRGQLVDRYDKRFCAGDASETSDELAHFTPGDHPVIFERQGLRCGLLICHEYRYPELYRELMAAGVNIVFHSFHAANLSAERQTEMEAKVGEAHFPHNPGRTLPEITMPASLISYAANNALWISASNSSTPESCFGAFVVRPDGVKVGQLPKNRAELLITQIDSEATFYDSTAAWRRRAMRGQLHSGTLVDDLRSRARNEL
jgi:deaminated glutathione amidase